jgi:hypothetical protein
LVPGPYYQHLPDDSFGLGICQLGHIYIQQRGFTLPYQTRPVDKEQPLIGQVEFTVALDGLLDRASAAHQYRFIR